MLLLQSHVLLATDCMYFTRFFVLQPILCLLIVRSFVQYISTPSMAIPVTSQKAQPRQAYN